MVLQHSKWGVQNSLGFTILVQYWVNFLRVFPPAPTVPRTQGAGIPNSKNTRKARFRAILKQERRKATQCVVLMLHNVWRGCCSHVQRHRLRLRFFRDAAQLAEVAEFRRPRGCGLLAFTQLGDDSRLVQQLRIRFNTVAPSERVPATRAMQWVVLGLQLGLGFGFGVYGYRGRGRGRAAAAGYMQINDEDGIGACWCKRNQRQGNAGPACLRQSNLHTTSRSI